MRKIIVAFILLLFPLAVLAEENSKEVINDTYQFSSLEGNNVQAQSSFEYRDQYFTESSYLGSKGLEILSIQAASASISWYGSELDPYELDSSENAHNIIDMLDKMNFKNISTNTYYTKEKKENSMGVAVGEKTIIQDGKKYTLLAVIPRSAGYKLEWVGDLQVGDGDIHEGFKLARDEVLRYVKKYIKDNNISGDLKIWTTGYSRGAAVANMLGGFFAGGTDYFGPNVSITPENVYCYTIGTPKGVKNGMSKNVELSVSANRNEEDYRYDTVGEAYNYTKGGTLSVSSESYNGIRSIVNPDDIFAKLPLEAWGFTTYGKTIASNEGLTSVDAMLEELNNINTFAYNSYTDNGVIKQFTKKKLDFKTISIVDGEGSYTPKDVIDARIKGLVNLVSTNKKYQDEHYQDALKAIGGTYGMSATLFSDNNVNVDTSVIAGPLIYSYLAYASSELQKEGKATNETEAITYAIEDLMTYISGEEIDKNPFSIDDFITAVAKYLYENEDQPITNAIVSEIIALVPDTYKPYVSSLKIFGQSNDISDEEGLKEFIKACYTGAAPGSQAVGLYDDPAEVRKILYMVVVFAQGYEVPEIMDIFRNDKGELSGEADFKDLVGVLLQIVRTVKDENGTPIKTYADMAEMADDKLIDVIDLVFNDMIVRSADLYGNEYRDDFQRQVNNLKANITQVRVLISEMLFYNEDGYNTGEIIENTATLISNAMLLPTLHFDELYLAQAKLSNRYEDRITEYCIDGDGQDYNPSSSNNLSFRFSFNYYEFLKRGKVYMDGIEVPRDKYTISKGSTIITFNDEYSKQLSYGEHNMIAELDDKKVEVKFTVVKEEEKSKTVNPPTGDNVYEYVVKLGICLIGFIYSIFSIKKIVKNS